MGSPGLQQAPMNVVMLYPAAHKAAKCWCTKCPTGALAHHQTQQLALHPRPAPPLTVGPTLCITGINNLRGQVQVPLLLAPLPALQGGGAGAGVQQQGQGCQGKLQKHTGRKTDLSGVRHATHSLSAAAILHPIPPNVPLAAAAQWWKSQRQQAPGSPPARAVTSG